MSKRVLCTQIPRKGRPVVLEETEAHHITRVLRLREGDQVEAMDGKGSQCKAILRVRGGPIRLEFADSEDTSQTSSAKKGALPLVLEMAVLKGEAMEWVVEKAVELGVNELVPVLSAHTVIQIKNKGPEAFRDRWQKIADQALKQCGRLNRMEVSLPISLEDLLSQSSEESSHLRLWCDEAGTSESPYILNVLQENSSAPADSKKPWRLLVGPEGGWSHLERELLLKESQLSSGGRISIRVHLGSLILRAETAALFGISLMASIQRSKENNS